MFNGEKGKKAQCVTVIGGLPHYHFYTNLLQQMEIQLISAIFVQ